MNWSNLKAAISAVIRTNNNQEITGAILQNTLNSIVNSVGANATFAGIATPSTSPGTPDGPTFWLVGQGGQYSNFNNTTVSNGIIGVFLFDSNAWTFTEVINVQSLISSLLTQINNKIGNLTELKTEDKTNLVNAINEVKQATEDLSGDAADIDYTDNYGIDATNVQEAIDKVGFVGTDMEIDLTQYNEQRAYITPDATPKWLTTNNTYPYKGIFIPVESGTKCRITANSNHNTGYAFLKSNTVGDNNSVVTTFATGCSRVAVTAGKSVTDTAPSDAKYMWVWTTASTTGDHAPQKIEALRKSTGEYLADIDDVPTRDSEKLVKSGGVYAHMPHMVSAVDATSDDFEVHARNTGGVNWLSNNGASHIVVPVIAGTEVTFTCIQSSGDGNWFAWLNDTYVPPTTNNKVPYVSGYSRSWGTLGVEYNKTVPEGAAYLMLGVKDGTGKTASWSIRYVTDRDLGSIVLEKVDIEQLEADKAELEAKIEHAKYNLPFDDVWSTNDASVIYPTRDGDNMVITTTSNQTFKRCGFDISEINVGETILIDFTSEVGIVFGFGETLGSAWAYITTAKSSFYFTKTSTTQKYIYIPANSYASTGVVLTLVGFKVYRSPNALEIDIDTLASYSFQPSSYIPIKEGYERYMSMSNPNGQGSTIYGDYFVNGFAYAANYKFIKIYNLLTKELIQQVDLPTLPNTRYHANTISFSGRKYDNSDVFPLLYICSGYTDSSSVTTSEVYVLRIVGTEGEWTTELVQTIYLDFGTWTEWVCDPVNNRAWINGSGIDKYICVDIPDITESEVTINADTPIIDHFNTKTFTLGLTTKSSGQGRFFYHNRIYWVSGVPSYAGEGDEALYVVVDNTLTHCTEAVVPLKNFGLASGASNTYEPEGCFIWNDEFYVAYRTFIARLIQN